MKNFTCFVLTTFLLLVVPLSSYSGSLDRAKEAYLYGDYNEAIRICQEIVEIKLSDEVLYFLALSYFKLGEYEKARDYFRYLLKEFKHSSVYETALVKLVDTYFLENNLDKAEGLYRSILEKYPSLNYKPLVYLRLAQVSAKKGRWSEEKKYLTLITENYKGSVESKLAQRLSQRGYFFTIQVGAFSKRDNALTYSREFKYKYPVYIVEEEDQDLVLYKVRVGKYKTRKQAEEIYQELAEKGYPARIYP